MIEGKFGALQFQEEESTISSRGYQQDQKGIIRRGLFASSRRGSWEVLVS
jgi:hypothetical protein